jgi:CheY-like chemotaxis protein
MTKPWPLLPTREPSWCLSSMIRSVASALLRRRWGFEVITASDGPELLEIFKERKDEISLAMLDLGMSGMSGWQTLPALRGLRPDIPVIPSSGYDEAQSS